MKSRIKWEKNWSKTKNYKKKTILGNKIKVRIK